LINDLVLSINLIINEARTPTDPVIKNNPNVVNYADPNYVKKNENK